MKAFKKILAVAIIAVSVMAIAVPAMAAYSTMYVDCPLGETVPFEENSQHFWDHFGKHPSRHCCTSGIL